MLIDGLMFFLLSKSLQIGRAVCGDVILLEISTFMTNHRK